MSDLKFEKPFIIWTLQRTGGTNLSKYLKRISPFRRTQDEPFNGVRQFGEVTQAWRRTQDKEALKASMAEILAEPRNIKHCIERVPMPVSLELVEAAMAQDYLHLFLYRINPTGRLLSMEYAERTRVWGPRQAEEMDEDDDEWAFEKPLDVDALIKYETGSNQRLNKVWRILVKAGQRPSAISFEELYGPDVTVARMGIRKMFKRMGMMLEAPQLNEILETVRGQGNQKTSDRYARFIGHEELAARIEEIPPLIFRANLDPVET